MDPATLTAAASIVVATIGGGFSVVAAFVANKARNNTKPISNGWSGAVTRKLDRLEELMVDHLEDHAEHDLHRRRN